LVALVHDELILEVPEAAIDEAGAELQHAMRRAWLELFPHCIELANRITEATVGSTWAACKRADAVKLAPIEYGTPFDDMPDDLAALAPDPPKPAKPRKEPEWLARWQAGAGAMTSCAR
jgi:hypothetical protein